MKRKAILFGAAGGGERLFDEITLKYEVICFADNDHTKWGKFLKKTIIKEPEAAFKEELFDDVIITSAPGCNSIYEQLLRYQIPEDKIITHYVDAPLKSRICFLEAFAMMIHEKNIKGACAEVGVFQGDFAECINNAFYDKELYLFDTFEGFAEKDVSIEQKYCLSNSKISDYVNTSADMVMRKMPYPEKCIIKKGYFPETANGIEASFCFVNLDLDLYLPTINGLNWFGENRMVKGGIILVHDYFAANFKGPKRAVDEFIAANQVSCDRRLHAVPIGDGISIMIVGF